MDTTRLRSIQRPSGLEKLLDALVRKSDILPQSELHTLRDPGALPTELQEAIKAASCIGRAWRCWSDGHRTWLLTAEVVAALSRQRRSPALQVNVYDTRGELERSGVWVCEWDGKWRSATA